MHLSDFDFHLPDEKIALRPVSPRDAARLLVVRPQEGFADRIVKDLPDLLHPGDVLVFNDTKVIPARLYGVRTRENSSARIEALLHKREGQDVWRAFLRPGKRVRTGDIIRFGVDQTSATCELAVLDATVVERGEGGEAILKFDLSGPALDEAIVRLGDMPLPPYIESKRAIDARDQADYQTVYARHEGAVAAPTAGLHFTDELLKSLDARGVQRLFVTLHVGAGTFLPVKTDDISQHQMHSEWGTISEDTAVRLNEARARGARIIAVGTTSLRLLESAAREDGSFAPFSGDTAIFITPGYRFKAIDALMTNFHLPRSTLFMLVSALCGLDTMKAAYAHAINSGYRFYSYGDSSLLFRSPRSIK